MLGPGECAETSRINPAKNDIPRGELAKVSRAYQRPLSCINATQGFSRSLPRKSPLTTTQIRGLKLRSNLLRPRLGFGLQSRPFLRPNRRRLTSPPRSYPGCQLRKKNFFNGQRNLIWERG